VIYRLLFELVLRRIPPETAHSMAASTMHAVGKFPGLRRLLRRCVGASDPCLRISALGLTFPSPVGVAAGMDKSLTWYEELGALGFSFVEVGTVTAGPQPGNPRPRLHRLVADRALINSMGFPNDGAATAAKRLRRRTGRTIVAVNVGMSKGTTNVAEDYRGTVGQLAPLADFIVLNVSSPNTPGLRDIQDTDTLAELVTQVRNRLEDLDLRVPLLIKISPDLADGEIDALADLALDLRLDGIVAVNTTTSRPGLHSPADASNKPGGLSGAPLKARALHILRRLSSRTRGELVLVSVGGIETVDDAWARILAGASLVQAYTAFVYGGPLWPSRINRGLAARVRASGAASIQELIAADAARPVASDECETHVVASGARSAGASSPMRSH
jgi:dihydroorotate dehydrogenase